MRVVFHKRKTKGGSARTKYAGDSHDHAGRMADSRSQTLRPAGFRVRDAQYAVQREAADKVAAKMEKQKGISVRLVNWLSFVLILVISVLLLSASARTISVYNQMRSSTESYIRWQHCANDLQLGSDYLTEQARCFALTGERKYLNNYFEEADVNCRRDRALAALEEELAGTQADLYLRSAMDESMQLMEQEYYAMRLAVEAHGYNVEEYPERIRNVLLSSQDAALEAEEKQNLAASLLLDQVYTGKKAVIARNTQFCIESLIGEVIHQQNETSDQLRFLLLREQIMILCVIVLITLVRLMTVFLVIQPVVRSVKYIQGEQPIPVEGGSEFRFLARTYNLMFAAHREQTVRLEFDATHDKLTGLYNRSGYDFILDNVEMETSALMVLDVDKFKLVNDTHGHEIGDQVLIRTAAVLRGQFRPQDYICRIGGDEFAVIVTKAGHDMEEIIREKVRRMNEMLLTPVDGLPPVSLSVGVAFGDTGEETAVIFRNADAALYRVKKSGRRNCAFYHPEIAVGVPQEG